MLNEEMIKIRESKLLLIVKILLLLTVTGLITMIILMFFWGVSLVALLTIALLHLIISTWFQTGIFEEGENIRFSNKYKGINTIFKKQVIYQIALQQGKITIELKDSGRHCALSSRYVFPKTNAGHK